MASVIQTVAYHPAGGEQAAIEAMAGEGIAWLNINNFTARNYIEGVPSVTFHFKDRAAVIALIQGLELVADKMLDHQDQAHRAAIIEAVKASDGVAPAWPLWKDPAEGPPPTPVDLAAIDKAAERIAPPVPVFKPFKGDLDLACSCPRYHNGLMKDRDPLCPLHAGDARD